MTNAGHPPAFGYRANRREWSWFDATPAGEGVRVSGTPLGLLPNVSYNRTIMKPDPGDLIVLYSDGVSEATDRTGNELGRDHLMTMARGLKPISAETFGTELVEACVDSAEAGHQKMMRRSSCCNGFRVIVNGAGRD